jgi:hypothetical protein
MSIRRANVTCFRLAAVPTGNAPVFQVGVERKRWALALVVPVLAAVLTSAPTPVLAQLPEPGIPEINRRSGLLGRFIPIRSTLPGDKKRDDWFDTRWGDPPNERKRPNSIHNGGLYGLPWRADCSASYYPYFFGSPGVSTMSENCRPWPRAFRFPQMLLHPFKPVCFYYDQGSYVPVYDLDPLVPGPGPWPWPFYEKLTHVGG